MRFLDRLRSLSWLDKWAIGITSVFIFYVLYVAWNERHFLATFAEGLTAIILYLGIFLSSVAAAFWVGTRTIKNTAKPWMGWTMGIIVCFSLFITLREAAKSLPVLGPYIEKIEAYQHIKRHGPR